MCTEHYFLILKNVFVNFTSTAERLATLYLMYAMYFKQPTKDFCKFRFTLSDWQKMKVFYKAISGEAKYLQVRAIFWRLWHANAFRFVETDNEYYPDTVQMNRFGVGIPGNFQKINTTIMGTVDDLQNDNKGLLSAIETLQVGYNEMKEHFAANFSDCSNLPSTQIINDIAPQLEKIKNLFRPEDHLPSENRHVKRQRKNALASTSKSSCFEDDDDIDSELEKSFSSCSESIDGRNFESTGADSIDDECIDENDIGAKRYNIKRKALNKTIEQLHRLRSTGANRISSQKNLEIPATSSQTDSQRDNNITITSPKTKNSVSVHTLNGNTVINYPKKIFNRYSKVYVSSVGKQFSDCPE